jgi:Nuclease-related domain
VWRQGAKGEERAATLLAKRLRNDNVRLLHDRRVQGHGRTNLDHLTIGPGGLTVIHTKTNHGKVSVERVGGLFTPRRAQLRIAGRNQTRLIDAVERQIELVGAALARAGESDIDIRGALCFPNVDGLPLLRDLSDLIYLERER